MASDVHCHDAIGADAHADVARHDGHTVVSVSGEFDANNIDRLARSLDEAITHRGPIVVDLADARFIDSSTIHLLVRVRSHQRQRSLDLTVRAPSPCAELVLGLTGYGDLVASSRVDSVRATPGAVNEATLASMTQTWPSAAGYDGPPSRAAAL